ncbi:MAG TPA: hypothetical protein VNO55_32385 [Polyangia bacterium]|nr:hypothetical protein [Polyangia bacterium]
MRGPLLSGPLGSAACLDAIVRWAGTDAPSQPVVLSGPLWLGETLSEALPVVMLVEGEDRPGVKRTRRRAGRAGRRFEVALAGAELPLRPRSLGALVIENVAGLEAAAASAWLVALTPLLRPGGRLIAADATASDTAMARVAAAFLSASLIELVQERPREGVVLTVGRAPAAAIMAIRFPAGAAAPLA